MIVAEPKPGSAPSHDEGSVKVPFPLVETSQTKYAENEDIKNGLGKKKNWFGTLDIKDFL